MNTLIGARTVAPSADDVCPLAHTAYAKENSRANGIPWTLWSSRQLERDPMVAVLHHIAKQRRCGIHVVQNDVQVAIVEEVPKRGPSCRNNVRQAAAGRRGNFLKLGPVQIAEKLRPFGPGCAPVPLVHGWVDMSVGNK